MIVLECQIMEAGGKMKIEKYKGGFSCEYADNPRIKKSIVDGEKRTITFQFVDGHTIQHMFLKDYFDVDDHVYMMQYGVDISEDGRLFFLHGWYARDGLGCFEIDTGAERWRVKIKHAQEAYVDGEYILCFFGNYGFARIMVKTGEIVKRYPYTYGPFYRIRKGYYFTPLKRGYYTVLNAELEPLYRIPEKEIAPYFDFIHSFELSGTMLTISGSFKSDEERELEWLLFQGKMNNEAKNRVRQLAAAQGKPVEEYLYSHPVKRTVDIAPYAVI